MRPIQRRFDFSKQRALPVRLCAVAQESASETWMAVIPPADAEVLELEGDAAATAWSDSVFVSDFTHAFEDSIPMAQ